MLRMEFGAFPLAQPRRIGESRFAGRQGRTPMQWFRSHLSFANVVSMLALFVALGVVSYAALKLPKNSVGSKQIKANAVKSGKVKNGALKAVDFGAGQLPRGEQ